MSARNKKILFVVSSAVFVLAFFFGNFLPASALTSDNLGLGYATATGLSSQDIRVTIANIIRIALGLIGVVSLVIVLYGGFVWMTSGGNEEKINEAKKIMVNWGIGLAIILLAFAIVTFIMRLLGIGGVLTEGPGNKTGQFSFGNSALGGGIIESHYPPRGAHCFNAPPSTEGCIPRNTKVIVTFKEKMDLGSFIKGYDNSGDKENDSRDAVLQRMIGNGDLSNLIKLDSDKDGVLNGADRCPGTPSGTVVDANGCSTEQANQDNDGDGVQNSNDQCLFTPTGSAVGGDGCAAGEQKLSNVDSYELQVEYNNVKVYLDAGNASDLDNALGFGANANKKVYLRFTNDHKTFIFVPEEYIGSASERTWYSARLGENIKKANGIAAFPSGPQGFYSWKFEVGTFVDLTPPKVKNVFPQHDPVGTYPEYTNVVVQVNFDKAIDPTTASGEVFTTDCEKYWQDDPTKECVKTKPAGNSFSQIVAYQLVPATIGGTAVTKELAIKGKFLVSNQYQTVEFITDNFCGTNSCGEDIFCLPANSKIKVVAKAPTIDMNNIPQAVYTGAGYDGVADTSGNSLNGNGENGLVCNNLSCTRQTGTKVKHCDCAIGPEEDNFFWQFATGGEPLKTSTTLSQVYPGLSIAERSNIDTIKPVEGLFGRIMMGSTLTSSNITLASVEDPSLPFWIQFNNEDASGDNRLDSSRVLIQHDPYQKAPTGNPNIYNYSAEFTSGVRDVYQNCYKPTSGPGCTGGPSCCNQAAYGGTCPQPLCAAWSPDNPNACEGANFSLGKTSRDNQRQSDLTKIQSAINKYGQRPLNAGEKRYVAGVFYSVWDSASHHNTNYWSNSNPPQNTAFYDAIVRGNYLSDLPLDPVNRESGAANYLTDGPAADFGYVYFSDGDGYILGTNLENTSGLPNSQWGNYQLKGGSPLP